MALRELLTMCEDLQDVEVVICDESINSKASILDAYLRKDVCNMPVKSIIAVESTVKVWAGYENA